MKPIQKNADWARPWVYLYFAFGLFAAGLGGPGSLALFFASAIASGCNSMSLQLLGIGAGLLLLLGIPHILVAVAYFRNRPYSLQALKILSAVNVVVNLAIASLLILQGILVGAVWILLAIVNTCAFVTFRQQGH